MNDPQQKIVKCAAGVIVAMLIFPPYHLRAANGMVRNMGYGLLFDPPQINGYIGSVDISLLLVQWAAAGVVAAVLWWLAKDKV